MFLCQRSSYGRGRGLGRGPGVGITLGVGVAVAVGVAVGGGPFNEAQNLKYLVWRDLVRDAGVFSVPSDAAGAVAVARVLPCSASV